MNITFIAFTSGLGKDVFADTCGVDCHWHCGKYLCMEHVLYWGQGETFTHAAILFIDWVYMVRVFLPD